MMETLQAFLKRLALVAIGLTGTQSGALAEDLARIPRRALEAVIEESEERWDERERGPVLALLARDPRPEVRVEVAASAGARPTAASAAVLRYLSCDPSYRVRTASAAGLAALLRASPMRERIEVVASWATARRARIRLALARALGERVEVVGGRTALALLTLDRSPNVRAAAHEALRALG
jgi:hypothetical protein